MGSLNYNELPGDPELLYAALEADCPLKPADIPVAPDMAVSAPTFGQEDGRVVYLCIVPSEKRAYKMLLTHANVLDLHKWAGLLLERPDLLPRPEETVNAG
jgi:hypothetical protein